MYRLYKMTKHLLIMNCTNLSQKPLHIADFDSDNNIIWLKGKEYFHTFWLKFKCIFYIFAETDMFQRNMYQCISVIYVFIIFFFQNKKQIGSVSSFINHQA
jgi:hypothetical protein